MLEAAIVLPFFLLLIIGILEFGRAVMITHDGFSQRRHRGTVAAGCLERRRPVGRAVHRVDASNQVCRKL